MNVFLPSESLKCITICNETPNEDGDQSNSCHVSGFSSLCLAKAKFELTKPADDAQIRTAFHWTKTSAQRDFTIFLAINNKRL